MIEFLCPEGHKIRCGEEQAGRPAKCPRCGVKFRIPTLEDLQGPAPAPSEATAAPSPEAQSGPAPLAADRKGDSSKGAQIEFLCPNGHHLHGPASLQGRPGECPECGSRFRIPSLEELAAAADENAEESPPGPADDEIVLEEVNPASSKSGINLPLDLLQVLDDASGVGMRAGLDAAPHDLVPGQQATGAAGVHPLAQIFLHLWAARGEGSRVEVHLESGGVLLPDGYVKGLSEHSQAVFVTNDPDNTYTLTIVPWETVARVILRGMQEVPGEVVR
jgi:hypothetical protein